MPSKTKLRTKEEKAAQADRTRKNKIAKYKKLISENPDSHMVSTWEKKMSHGK